MRQKRPEPPRRPDMADLWKILEADVLGDDGFLNRDFLHFPAGAPNSAPVDWFILAHRELDALEQPVVEVRVRRLFRTTTHVYPCRILAFLRGKAYVDGEEKPELAGRTVVGVEWVSGKGRVDTALADPRVVEQGMERRIRLRGVINGVMTRVEC